ncbi:MAG TPA: MlaD family protein, partial [Candidatus Dormibacteraeota bacterium]|nr:MlaD family protein [Candidatus Dormibacteraeota bacterium]
MALQDLTPQLRTRLSRMERAVGWFVILAAGLLLFGFGYYLYNTAESKGWFKIKAPYFTYTEAATGLKVGDPVRLMGLDVGRITRMEPMPPENFEYNMFVEFELREPYYGYVWTVGSKAKVAIADLLGKRFLEVTKGSGGYPTYIFFPFRIIDVSAVKSLPEWEGWSLGQEIYDDSGTNLVARPLSKLGKSFAALEQHRIREVAVLDTRQDSKGKYTEEKKYITAVWNDHEGRFDAFPRNVEAAKNKYWLKSDESPSVTDRLQQVVDTVEKALPNILNLTNQLANVLSNTANLTSNLDAVVA